MHANRRRKKRPTYGVRTVEITKGKKGFGFTITGDAPCILKCIVSGSPAEKAGLKPGDYLIAVNGTNVSKVPHDAVACLIGLSNLLKLQIAENYFSDSSDDEFPVNRPKPKYPNRLRHKNQQTRAEKVVCDLQSGAIFSEHAAIHMSEAGLMSDRDWPENFPSNPPNAPPAAPPPPRVLPQPHPNCTSPSTSPTRLLPIDQRLLTVDGRQTSRTPRPQITEEIPQPVHRMRHSPKKKEKIPKINKLPMPDPPNEIEINHETIQYQFQQPPQLPIRKAQMYPPQFQPRSSIQQQLAQLPPHPQHPQHSSHPQQHATYPPHSSHPNHSQHSSHALINPTHPQHPSKSMHQSLPPHTSLSQHQNHQSVTFPNRSLHQTMQHTSIPQHQSISHSTSSVHLHKTVPLPSTSHHQHQKMSTIPLMQHPDHSNYYSGNSLQQSASTSHSKSLHHIMYSNHQTSQANHVQHHYHQLNSQPSIPKIHPMSDSETPNVTITEQEINNLLYPTLAELQQAPPPEAGESLYRAVVGYLGTIEMPKEPQAGSRLTAIRNCIRRLRIEKKVHTLVLMSVFTERVVLTNPHGLTLAQYPAERITFCGVYADDKKFFGLVTIHGSSSDELSDGSQDGDIVTVSSSSCHVFMVDPRMVQHSDHGRRAKNFRIDCTLAPDDVSAQCQEFPDSADPILHAIMSLYRNRVGFHLDTGAPGLIDVEAQMSPQHSNTSSNSSNSDSGIGFRDDGGHHYHHQNDRVFVVEVDDNQRVHIQNYQSRNRNANENYRQNGVDHHRQNITANFANNVNNFVSESSDSSSTHNVRTNLNLGRNVPTVHTRAISSMPNGEKFRGNLNESSTSSNILDNMRTNMTDNYNIVNNNNNNNQEIYDNSDNLRASVSDSKRLNDIRASIAENRLQKVSGRTSVTDEIKKEVVKQDGRSSITDEILGTRESPIGGCSSPVDVERLNVRAMPDPITFERAPRGYVSNDVMHVQSIRHSMHKYLQHKQEHLVKVSQKINKRELDVNPLNPLSVRAFSPSTKQSPAPKPLTNIQNPLDLELSLKLSPKVYGLPMRSSAPSERSFTRSLEDLRDSSTSEGLACSAAVMSGGPGSFIDGSESDNGLRHLQMNQFSRMLHVSETNLTRYGPVGGYVHDTHRGAFRAVAPRSIVPHSSLVRGVGLVTSMIRTSETSCDEHTETTENTGDQEGSQDVHPPTEGEFSQESDLEQVDNTVDKPKCSNPRSSSLRHPTSLRPIRPDSTAAHSDTDLGKVTSSCGLLDEVSVGSVSSDHGLNISRVGLWATSFEKLIEDPAGLHTFAEFLKTEYSHENIYFWTACERYKRISDPEERKSVAKQIYERHLCVGAQEPVNIDGQARQVAGDNLHEPDEMLFSAAQKQIFNLMKLDSYSRFLKSSLYKKCETLDLRDQNLPYPGDDTLDPDLRITPEDPFKLKKSKSDADERRRKSLLPWHRKDRSKSKDRGEADYRRRKNKLGHRNTSDSSSVRSDVTGSRTSINSSDFHMGRRAVSKESLTSGDVGSLTGAEGLNWCRVYLPDTSNSVLALRSGETVHQLLQRLLEKRGINFSAFNVYNVKNDKIIDLNKEGTVLDRQEVRVEEQVLFRLDLPNRKTVCVKAKTNKIIGEVLKPILHKYGYKLDLMTVHKIGEATGVNLKGSVKEMNGQIFSVQTKEELKEYMDPTRFRKRSTTLDVITNKVFEDLLKGKSQLGFDELGVIDIDAQSAKTDLSSSDQSSSLIESLSRRSSLAIDKETKGRKCESQPRASVHDSLNMRDLIPNAEAKLPKRRTHNLANPSSPNQDNDELYEGLKRAQRCRLDDQRGTEINFELPDFLKCDQSKDSASHLAEHLLAQLNSSFDGVLPSHQEAHDYFSLAHPEVWGSVEDVQDPLITSPLETTLMAKDLDLDDLDETIHASRQESDSPSPTALLVDSGAFSSTRGLESPLPSSLIPPSAHNALSSSFISPPPLPPKPKIGVPRGPPPRPPSRQHHQLNPPTSYSSTNDDALHLVEPPMHITRQCHDAFSISFV